MKNVFNFSHFSILITTILLLLSSCQKNDNSACVDCYNNIVRCKINGVDWKPYCEGDLVFGCTPIKISFYEDIGYLELIVQNSKDEKNLRIIARNIVLDSIFRLEHSGLTDYKSQSNNCVHFKFDSLKSFLKISNLESSKRIIQGEFGIKLNNMCNDTFSISQGYFDLKY